MAEAGAVTRTTQHLYEHDVRVPDVRYLERLRAVGVDVRYLVLGDLASDTPTEGHPLESAALSQAFQAVDQFCVNGDGHPLPLGVRTRMFTLLYTSIVAAGGKSDVDLAGLQGELSRLTGT